MLSLGRSTVDWSVILCLLSFPSTAGSADLNSLVPVAPDKKPTLGKTILEDDTFDKININFISNFLALEQKQR